MRITKLSRQIYIKYAGKPPCVTMIGIAVIDDNDVFGILAVAKFNGESFIICDVKKDVPKRLIVQAWRLFKDNYMVKKSPYYAIMDGEIETAPRFLAHFGFNRLKDNIYIYGE